MSDVNEESFLKGSSNDRGRHPLQRRKSDSNLLDINTKKVDTPQQRAHSPYTRKSSTQYFQLNKSISVTMAERQLSKQAAAIDKDKNNGSINSQEDTFYRALEIKFHHSVGSMSISPACRDVVLAGRQGLVIIDLEDPWLIPRILPHMSKWEVADVQWSPHILRESWIASTSNQKLLVWNLNYSGTRAIEHVFHAHARAISDINWSPLHPDILATCSVDTYVHLWDLREPQINSQDQNDDRQMRPTFSFTPWNAAATQVKFNRRSEHLIASAHDKEVKIWDLRKGAVPVTSITAHSKKIYGIDWSRQNDHDIVTCSLDKLVKFWNIHSPDIEEEVISTNTPIWRARNTPFGNGVLIMPQRTDSKLTLYNRSCPETPVHAFDGHKDTVKEFVWRWKGDSDGVEGDDREFQLVTWSKDQNLRLWPVSEDIMRSMGHKPSASKTKLSMPAVAFQKNSNYCSHSFQQEPMEKSSNEYYRSSFQSTTPVRLTPNSNLGAYRSSIPNTNFTAGFEQANAAYREQKYSAINPLLWMQNVKTLGPPPGTDNTNNISTRLDANGEIIRATENTYQSVAEEMSTVLNKYLPVGVKTEKINAASRTCTISLHGPWSDTGDALIRITIKFSPQYPDNSPPEFDIQKNSMISIYYRAHMTRDLNALANSYTSQKKWCLEPCLRYLLGESMQEESELDNPNSSFDSAGPHGILGSPGYYKGGAVSLDADDSDDELGPGWSIRDTYHFGKRESMTSEKGIMMDMSAKQSSDAKVPFPRLCGGIFSGSGQLVCFFSTLRVRDRNKNNRVKESVGDLSVTKSTVQQQQQQDNSGQSHQSDHSNGEYFETTYSDFYRHPKTYEQFEEYKEIAAMSRQGKNANVLVGGSGRVFGEYEYDEDHDDMDDALSTVGSMGGVYYKTDNITLDSPIGSGDDLLYHGTKTDRISHNVVIVDYSDKMPYSPWLAKEYILSSEDPVTACIHNAEVCRKYGRLDLYKVWCVAVEILRECVPSELPDTDRVITDGRQMLLDNFNSETIINNENWQRDRNLMEVKKMLYNNNFVPHLPQQTLKPIKPLQRVKWGIHPLGQKLVNELLQHFVSMGDIQTAAMLSCTFQVQSNKIPTAFFGQKPFVLNVKTPAEVAPEMDYFSLRASQRCANDGYPYQLLRANSGPNTNNAEKIAITPLSTSYGATKSNSLLSYIQEARRPSPIDRSLLDPPILNPTMRRNSRLTRKWTKSHPKLTIPSNTAPGIRLMASDMLETSPALASPIIVTPNTPLFNKEGRIIEKEPSEIKIEFTNMEYFDNERFVVEKSGANGAIAYDSISLMDPGGMAQRDVLCLRYAEMLYCWHLLEQRAEVLRFLNYQPFPLEEKEVRSTHIQVSCYSCGTELSSTTGNVDNERYCCLQCRKVRKWIRCSFCHILVKGLVNFCIHCGHGGHSEHMEQWFVTNRQVYCMTGCGCKCALESLDLQR
ncbi:hypothetical protein BDF20DRAFT_871014 [Mycotypha africana]|uniref:uncharacterized protein n=1 Tax=Mycotypha africana TaxID=64632 RepID=UPI0023018B53|nr:uncharacterized protein BDF20DRAFT_871014 [Mycotypha africana]KAI8979684.1 hypothetical protein BDF20DRAFT_871014 [Mycotypha africana]